MSNLLNLFSGTFIIILLINFYCYHTPYAWSLLRDVASIFTLADLLHNLLKDGCSSTNDLPHTRRDWRGPEIKE
jgi:hypothetical protein